VSKKLRLLTFGSVNYASTAGGYAAVTKGLNYTILYHTIPYHTIPIMKKKHLAYFCGYNVYMYDAGRMYLYTCIM